MRQRLLIGSLVLASATVLAASAVVNLDAFVQVMAVEYLIIGGAPVLAWVAAGCALARLRPGTALGWWFLTYALVLSCVELFGAVSQSWATMTTGGGTLPNGQPRPTCGEQFKTGLYRVDSAVRDRDFPVVDEERGLVLSRAFIDHNGVLTEYKTTDGASRTSNQRWPSTFSVLELFKIKNGKILRIEVVHTNVPYHMPSVWRRDHEAADAQAVAAWSGGAK
jgi:hypothetical protein